MQSRLVPVCDASELPGGSEPLSPVYDAEVSDTASTPRRAQEELEMDYHPARGHKNPYLSGEVVPASAIREMFVTTHAITDVPKRFRFDTIPFTDTRKAAWKFCNKRWTRVAMFSILVAVVILVITYVVLRYAPSLRWAPVLVQRTPVVSLGDDVQRVYMHSANNPVAHTFLLQPESGQMMYTAPKYTVVSNGTRAYVKTGEITLRLTSHVGDFSLWTSGGFLALPDGWISQHSTGAGVRLPTPFVNLSDMEVSESLTFVSDRYGKSDALEFLLLLLAPTPPSLAYVRVCEERPHAMLNDTLYICSQLANASVSTPSSVPTCASQYALAQDELFKGIFMSCKGPDWGCVSRLYYDIQSQYLMTPCMTYSVNSTYVSSRDQYPCGVATECRGPVGVQVCYPMLQLCHVEWALFGQTHYERMQDYLSDVPPLYT